MSNDSEKMVINITAKKIVSLLEYEINKIITSEPPNAYALACSVIEYLSELGIFKDEYLDLGEFVSDYLSDE